jgi:AraC-like DNA-binding protein
MISEWPTYKDEFNFSVEEQEMERIMEAVRAIRNRRAEMNVPPSRKAKYYIATSYKDTFRQAGIFMQRLASCSDAEVGDSFEFDDAVCIVTTDAKVYIPMGDLVDFEAEIARLEKDKAKPITSSVLPAIRHIELSDGWDYDIPYLASLCGMSESNFYAVFKKQMNMTPIEYKNKLRCIRVTELLRNSNYTVEYISQKLSFSSPMYMRKLLKKYTGKTPGLIRKEKTGSV